MKQKKLFGGSVRRLKAKFRRRLRSKPKLSIGIILLCWLVVAGVVVGAIFVASRPNYSLSPKVALLIGTPDASLVKEGLSYSASTGTYYLNKKAIGAKSSNTSITVGGNQAYSLKLSKDINKGATYYDNKSGLSFSLDPEFKANSGHNKNGQFIYPIGKGNVQAVYTVKANGLQEDIVLNKSIGPNASFSYKLALPDTLQARMMPTGAIGIYSADPSLFGNISYGSSGDQLDVAKARINSPKNNLVFALMTPAIYDSGRASSVGHVHLSLKGNLITMTASDLSGLHYPLTIDPSVVVTSASNFGQNANNESDVAMNISTNQISEAGLDGGITASTWTSTTPQPSSVATESISSIAYNGYIYNIGGYIAPAGTPINSVNYAPINSNGSLGSWTATTNFPVLWEGTDNTTVYNGYIYALGGASGNPGTASRNVYYDNINANGSLGPTWISGTILPTTAGQELQTVVSYHNYIYDIAGNNSNITANVFFAAINADGSIGSWTSTTAVPAATEEGTSVVYNGYVYEIGGTNGNPTTTVYYAAINANGTLGSWATATNTLQALVGAGNGIRLSQSVAYNGYLYEIGGIIGTNSAGNETNAVDYAAINSDGSLGPWMATYNLPAADYEAPATAYNGYLYIFGGNTGGMTETALDYYVQIQPAGSFGGFTADTALSTAVQYSATVAYNGYIYEIGGWNLTPAYQRDVWYAPITSGGVIGSWTADVAMTAPNAVAFTSAVAYNGFLYIIGGQTTTNYTNFVWYSPLNASTGAPGTFTQTTTVPPGGGNGTDMATAVTYNGYLYEIGGSIASAPSTSVYYSLICTGSNSGTGGCGATAGTVGTWQSATSLPAATQLATSVVWNGYVYEIGGTSNGTTPTNKVYYALICTAQNSGTGGCTGTAGALGTWTNSSSNYLPTATMEASSVVNNGYIYEMGGNTGNSTTATITSAVYYAAINSNGSLGTWNTTTPLQTSAFYASAASYNGYAYVLGGNTTPQDFTGGVTTSVESYLINNGGPGITGSWTNATNNLPGLGGDEQGTSVAYNGFLYELGGSAGSGITGSVYDAPLSSSGNVGSWTTANTLPNPTYLATTVISNGYIYEIGGQNASSTTVNNVYYALICTAQNSGIGGCSGTAGSLGTWINNSAYYLPSGAATYAATSVAYNGYIYEIGGFTTSKQATIYYASINPSTGAPGTWTTAANPLPTATNFASSVVYNGILYEIGGINTAGNTVPSVYYSSLNPSTGAPGTWTATTNLPSGGVAFGTAAAYNGYLYEIGGIINGGGSTTVDYAPISSGGGIGSWTPVPSLTQITYNSASPVYNGYVYTVAGYSASARTGVIEYAPLYSIPRLGDYSILLDSGNFATGQDPAPVSLLLGGTNTGNQQGGYSSGVGGISVAYELAGNACTPFGSPTTLNANNSTIFSFALPMLTTATSCGVNGYGRYAWLNIQLDDSQTATFPDVNGNHTSVSDITYYYHPATGARLRGGGTFSSGGQQTLDAPP